MSNDTRFKKGHVTWNKGLKATDDIRIKTTTDAAHKARKGQTPWNKGLTKNTCPLIARYSKEKSEWWKNTDTTETRRKIGEASKNRTLGKDLSGKNAFGWKGGRFKESRKGYIYIYLPNHPLAIKNGKGNGGHYLEHRYVMEQHLGRILTQNEEVHHKNGIKDDNRLENLELVLKSAHFGIIICPHCQKEIKLK